MTIAIKKELFVCGENDFTDYINQLVLPLSMSRLRSQLSMLQLVTVNTSDESKSFGDKVKVPMPVVFGKADKFDPAVGSQASEIKAEGVEVQLNNQIYKEVKANDAEVMKCAANSILHSALEGMVDALAVSLNEAVFDCYKDISNFSGVLESINPRDKSSLIGARKGLQVNKVFNNRKMVLTNDTESDLLLELSKVNETGDQVLVNEGFIGRKFGWDIYTDNQAPTHLAGTASEVVGITAAGINLAGSPVLKVSSVEEGATFVRGDILKVAGGYSLAVAADIEADATGNVEIPVVGGLKLPVVAGTAIEVVGTHNVDLGFTPAAFMVAFRQLETPGSTPGVEVGRMTDPLSGITLRLMRWYNPVTEATHWKLETLCGVKTIDPARAIRMGGH